MKKINWIALFSSYELIMIIRSEKYGFMRVTSQIFNTVLETLETSKSKRHSLGFQTAIYVTNFDSTHKSNVLYPSDSMSKISIIYHFYHMKGIFC